MYSSFHSQTILVVDDQVFIREAVAAALTMEGYSVLLAEDGRQALEQVHSTVNLDLIVLDLVLPYLSGHDLCRKLRGEGCCVPILVVSGRSSQLDCVLSLELGADDFLHKPFGMRELIARCRALLRRWIPQTSLEPAILRHGELMLNPTECRVQVSEDEVNLSPKEFRLLEVLMRNPHRVWSRKQLIEYVWGPDFSGDTKTVDVHVRWLREKIEKDPSNPAYLVTVRGFGYRFG